MSEFVDKWIVRDLKNIVDAGGLTPEQFVLAVKDTLKQLAAKDEKKYEPVAMEFFEKTKPHEEEMNKHWMKIMENTNKLYENMLKQVLKEEQSI